MWWIFFCWHYLYVSVSFKVHIFQILKSYGDAPQHLTSVSICWESFYLATLKDAIIFYIIMRLFFPVTYIFINYAFLVFCVSYVHTLVFKETSWFLCTGAIWHTGNLSINNPFNYCCQAQCFYSLLTVPFCILSSCSGLIIAGAL